MKLIVYILSIAVLIVICSFFAEYTPEHYQISVKMANWIFGMIAGIGIGMGSIVYHIKRF